jgi:hypothetical protein
MDASRVRSFFAGMLVANSAPHLATAVRGKTHLTPLRGRKSGPAVNAVWGGANLAAGLALIVMGRSGRWPRDLHDFEAGYLTFSAWMTVTDRLMGPKDKQ